METKIKNLKIIINTIFLLMAISTTLDVIFVLTGNIKLIGIILLAIIVIGYICYTTSVDYQILINESYKFNKKIFYFVGLPVLILTMLATFISYLVTKDIITFIVGDFFIEFITFIN